MEKKEPEYSFVFHQAEENTVKSTDEMITCSKESLSQLLDTREAKIKSLMEDIDEWQREFVNAAKLNHKAHSQAWGDCTWSTCLKAYIAEREIMERIKGQ